MGKVLHASYSGYFPFCIEQGTPSSSKEYLSLTLLEAMTLFWRVKTWEVNANGQLDFTYPESEAPSKSRFLQYITYPSDSFFVCETRGTNITTEEDFVCVQDADNFVFASIGRIPESFQFGPTYEGDPLPPPILSSIIQFFFFEFTTLDERIITDGSNFFVRFISFVGGSGVGTKDLENSPENTKIVGSYSISFGGYTKGGNLYGRADGYLGPDGGNQSGNVSLQIRAKEYWPYGGTYNTETGLPL